MGNYSLSEDYKNNRALRVKTASEIKSRKALDSFLWKKNYNSTIAFIESHEGFNNGRPYRCPSGELTIGFGHIIKNNEAFPDSGITYKTAHRLLRKDFNKAISIARLYSDLEGCQLIAVAHFIYAKGVGSFLRSGLKDKIDGCQNPDAEFAKWCYYTQDRTGKKIRSKKAEEICAWEIEMFHAEDFLNCTPL